MGSGTCRRCGADLTESAFGSLCPGCLFREGLEGTDLPSAAQSLPQPGGTQSHLTSAALATVAAQGMVVSFGDYELLEKVGQGGMGVVYRARQKSLDRIVALKLLLFGPHATPESVKRFRAEAVATAALQHPNIVAVHEVGVWQGQHFIAMDYVEGPSLSTVIRGTTVPARRAAGYVKTIAEAIHFAHERGILHRDLKPANVLIDTHDQARVTDFGLARRLESDSELTLTGQVLGSPNYISPEQASGKRQALSRRSDVYSLGAILYETLTGRPPFVGESFAETVHQVLNSEPPAPHVLQPGVPADLETVCLKCLEKEPAKRYATAQMVADELDRFLQGQPVQARHVGTFGKTWRWCRRNPRLALAVGTALLTLLCGLLGVSWQWRRAEAQRRIAEQKELLARQNAYAADMNLAQRALGADQVSLVLGLLDKYRPTITATSRSSKAETDLRGWEWRYLWQLCQSELSPLLPECSGPSRAGALSPDGRLLATAATGKGVCTLWDLPSGKQLGEFPAAGWLRAMAFSADSQLLAVSRSGDGKPSTVECWQLPRLRLAHAFNPPDGVRSLAFSPDGRLLATLNDAGTCEILEWRSLQSVTNLASAPIRRAGAGVLAFSPDGRRLAIGADYGSLRVLELRSGAVQEIETKTVQGISAVAFSPDGQLLAACLVYIGETVCLWDASSGAPRGELTNAAAHIRALAFSPDGQQLAAASINGSIAVWDVAKRTQLCRARGHLGEGEALLFGADRKLTSVCAEATVCQLDLAAAHVGAQAELTNAFGLTPNVSAESFSSNSLDPRVVHRLGFTFTPDSRGFITTKPGGALGVWDARTAQETESLAALGSNCWQVALSPGGHWLAAGEASGCIRIWAWPARRLVATLEFPYEFCGHLRFSTSERFLHATGAMNTHRIFARIWRSETWTEIPFTPLQVPDALSSWELSPDDRTIAIGYKDGAIKLWDFPSGRLKATFMNHTSWVNGLLFSQDGRRLFSVGFDGQLCISDVINQRNLTRLPSNSVRAWSAALSPDGQRLLTGGDQLQEAVKLWDLATERELLTLPAWGQHFMHVAFSPDGDCIAATSLAGVVHLWRAPAWEKIQRAEGRLKQ